VLPHTHPNQNLTPDPDPNPIHDPNPKPNPDPNPDPTLARTPEVRPNLVAPPQARGMWVWWIVESGGGVVGMVNS
jgi:hypothetical protein